MPEHLLSGYNVHLMSAVEGYSEFCFPESPNVSRESQCFPRVPMFPESPNVSRDEVEQKLQHENLQFLSEYR